MANSLRILALEGDLRRNTYCVFFKTRDLDNGLIEFLFEVSQTLMMFGQKRIAVEFHPPGLKGEVCTEYKFGFHGHSSGIVFNAFLVGRGQGRDSTIDIDFISRPINRLTTPETTWLDIDLLSTGLIEYRRN